jgi:hypothetical protein
MNQSITVTITGTFPNYAIVFSADPIPVPFKQQRTITYTLSSDAFRFTGISLQRNPFDTDDELTWAIPASGAQLILTDINADPIESIFCFQILFADLAGNAFTSTDPQVRNEGKN